MAEVVMLKDRKPRSVRRERVDGEGADILLFTGIRYERTAVGAPVDRRLPAVAKLPAQLPAPGQDPWSV
ncbi:hypothetical protein J5J10_12645 [Ciceribacter sp. L1K23]|uniref:hypothetical protein n=1 Tax=Ciceribacter sp. L1K23 TaxID=2820276 RepID=UPI001B823A06|nr:hypothetical protein [Ciceribacter sp. L1K23]MBR0556528.1 hypothetical protein [Ciceribacter sp. L1K23]